MSGMQQEIISRLNPLAPQHIEFHDDSHRHAGHADNNGGGHFRLLIVSQAFHGLSRLQRQRAVQSPLQALFDDGLIHALSIRALTPEEYAA